MLCSTLVHGFPLLRTSSALNPRELGDAKHALGPSGDIRITGHGWRQKLKRIMADVPLIVFDAREMTIDTVWELTELFTSSQLPKTIIVGPVQDPCLAGFLKAFGGVPIVAESLIAKALKVPAASRTKLLEWRGRRRQAIGVALRRIQKVPFEPKKCEAAAEGDDFINCFYNAVPRLLALDARAAEEVSRKPSPPNGRLSEKEGC